MAQGVTQAAASPALQRAMQEAQALPAADDAFRADVRAASKLLETLQRVMA